MEDKKKLLFVEGVNDKEVIYRIENQNGIRGICEVRACKSVKEAKIEFEIYLNENASKVAAIGIVVDADSSISSRWTSIRNSLIENGFYEVPSIIPETGLVLESKIASKPRVGVWIMPNNRDNGMLEDFLLLLTESNNPLLSFVDETIDRLKENGLLLFSNAHMAKARAHTYLAWQEEPGATLATAIEKQYFDSDSLLAKSFAFWMKQLFE